MKTKNAKLIGLPVQRSIIAIAVSLIACPASAQESPEEIRHDLATPSSRIEAGIGFLSGDRRRGGEFTGVNSEGAYGLLNLDLIKRDDTTGTWLKLKGRNLGLDNRDIRFDHERQGDWAYFLEASQLPRDEPLIVNTGLRGIDQKVQTINGVAKRDVDLKLDHDIYSIGVRKFIDGGFEVRASFRQDEKRGDRMYGRGSTVGPFSPLVGPANSIAPIGAQEFLTEPIDRTTRLWELIVNYADRKIQLSGGYSGSSYENRAPRLDIIGGSTATIPVGAIGAGTTGPVFAPGLAGAINPALTTEALPPSNYAHQFHLAGGYNFSDDTRSSFKLSKSLAFRNEPFAVADTFAGAPKSLNGRLDTTLAFADLSTRPFDRLDLSAALRYEDRDDQTPVAQYIPSSPPSGAIGGFPFSTAGVTGFNKPSSLRQLKGSVEAGYQLDDGYRLIAGLEQEQISRNIPDQFRRVSFREKTDETQGRIEIKRSLSETLNGSLAFIHSDRGGSDYVPVTYVVTPTIQFNLVNPLAWADRRRDKLRVTGDWLPDEQWSLQFLGDISSDAYSGRELGPRKGTSTFASGDLNYTINDKWKLSAWVSQERTLAEQKQRTDPAAPFVPAADLNMIWEAQIRNTSTAWGVGIKGKPKAALELGADLSSSTDIAEHALGRISGGTAATSIQSLPDFYYRQLSLKLFADYALERYSGIRTNLVHEHRRNNDWTWQNYVYTDGTTVINPSQENSTFVGVTYYYRWR